MTSAVKFWKLGGRELWGDYGSILFGGMIDSPERTHGQLNLMRTGPFVPPLTVVDQHVIVTERFSQLMLMEFPVLQFRPVNLSKVVRIPWHEWDPTEKLPKYPPAGLEPENYIMRRKHSADLAAAMQPPMELVLNLGAESKLDASPLLCLSEVMIHHSSWNGSEIFFVNPRGTNYPIVVAETMHQWILENAADWASFKELETY